MIYQCSDQRYRAFLLKGDVCAEITVWVTERRSVKLGIKPHELVSRIVKRVLCWIGTQPDLSVDTHADDTYLVHVGKLRSAKSLFDQGVFYMYSVGTFFYSGVL